MGENQRNVSRFDWNLAFLLFLFFCVSITAINSAQTIGQYDSNFVIKQVAFYVIGTVIIAFVMRLDSDQLQKLSWVFYGFGNFLLIFLIIAPSSIAREINGAKSWFTLPGFSFQPSEFVKVFLIIVLSNIIVKHNEKYRIRTIREDLLLLAKMGATLGFPLLLVMQQPDLGTALVLLAIFVGLVFVSGVTWKLIVPAFLGLGSIGAGILALVIYAPDFLEKYLGVKQYQFGRIYAWLDPTTYSTGEAYHLVKSLNAIGSGMVNGKGPGNGVVYIPESQTDFIFAVIGEEFGFIGGSIVISLFFLLIYYLIKLGLETKNEFNSYLCVGVITMITFHVFQNIGMTIQVLPITGIPLPFISYGGSSLMGSMFAIGLMFGISWHQKRYMFGTE
ncbi:rod shape-determining protein RodA [Priestia aryabhattai]|uniref:FtsW/RodA/SpoVE family cell cycle protein n=1 Tax=Priestia TaxID=2800373 RepID=UPI000B9FB84B|nr:FtsW/RodA/SpoVE family cell cycle protein [Priestia flexa]MDT2046012.1 FtsW/RodA/SpoVE family cell cycle protein [Priestia flexa]OZT11875.1 rod shape-determining protein RodA [Priestia aryabhattai]USY53953.1 rod shape-determining protein RodA [Bacillus sp. 1780r2a1]